ncbi:radical SAM protein [Oceanirhabdus sp. W0125-5]|uniref:radical SAM protein n=1 Tax=Oceanirhabdus sp. W0125-5 TaxID=2999116 RepID=UPI0022F2D7E8|nr:radical SAM protein [Oceanirhabdus sp. W0125-5]WBW96298.1 radical SAM protein [Oceanirhabdus sp. W0125-5]
MYPYVLKSSSLHFFDDYGVLFTEIGNYILNDIEVYMIQKFTGKNTIEDIAKEISKEIESDDIQQIQDIIIQFIESKPDAIFISEEENQEPLKKTGEKDCKIPLMLTISLTNKCNLQCIHCFKSCSMKNNNSIKYETLMNTLKYLKGKSLGIQLTGGEPMLHEKFFDILRFSIDNFDTTITTTGTLINSSNVEKLKGIKNIQLSLYSHIESKHDNVTTIPGSFKETVNAINVLSKAGLPVTIATILTKENINQMEDIIEFSYKNGAGAIRFGSFVPCGRGVSLRESWVLPEEEKDIIKLELKRFAEKYKGKIGIQTWEDEEKDKELDPKYKAIGCGAGLFTWAISERGIVKPCEFLDDNVCVIGNLYKEPVEHIAKDYNFDSMPQGLLKWEEELRKDNCTVKEMCPQIKKYYEDYCITKNKK